MTPQECADAFGESASRAAALQPVLEDFAERMKGSLKENFIAGGRPVAWTPTLNPPPNHRATLVNTGALLDSTTAFVEGGTDVVLAAGGGGQPPAKAPTLQYGANYAAKQRGGRFVSSRTRKNVQRAAITIPARPYVLFQDADLQYLGDRLPEYVFTMTGAAPIVPSAVIF